MAAAAVQPTVFRLDGWTDWISTSSSQRPKPPDPDLQNGAQRGRAGAIRLHVQQDRRANWIAQSARTLSVPLKGDLGAGKCSAERREERCGGGEVQCREVQCRNQRRTAVKCDEANHQSRVWRALCALHTMHVQVCGCVHFLEAYEFESVYGRGIRTHRTQRISERTGQSAH